MLVLAFASNLGYNKEIYYATFILHVFASSSFAV